MKNANLDPMTGIEPAALQSRPDFGVNAEGDGKYFGGGGALWTSGHHHQLPWDFRLKVHQGRTEGEGAICSRLKGPTNRKLYSVWVPKGLWTALINVHMYHVFPTLRPILFFY